MPVLQSIDLDRSLTPQYSQLGRPHMKPVTMTNTTTHLNGAIHKPLSREELADLLGMSPRTIERYDQAGRIRTILVGNKKRVPPSEVARIIEEGI